VNTEDSMASLILARGSLAIPHIFFGVIVLSLCSPPPTIVTTSQQLTAAMQRRDVHAILVDQSLSLRAGDPPWPSALPYLIDRNLSVTGAGTNVILDFGGSATTLLLVDPGGSLVLADLTVVGFDVPVSLSSPDTLAPLPAIASSGGAVHFEHVLFLASKSLSGLQSALPVWEHIGVAINSSAAGAPGLLGESSWALALITISTDRLQYWVGAWQHEGYSMNSCLLSVGQGASTSGLQAASSLPCMLLPAVKAPCPSSAQRIRPLVV